MLFKKKYSEILETVVTKMTIFHFKLNSNENVEMLYNQKPIKNGQIFEIPEKPFQILFKLYVPYIVIKRKEFKKINLIIFETKLKIKLTLFK